jgi:hypothetical protein
MIGEYGHKDAGDNRHGLAKPVRENRRQQLGLVTQFPWCGTRESCGSYKSW